MRKFSIYVLKDPRDNKIKYVGATCRALTDRLSNHIYYAKKRRKSPSHLWILELLSLDLRPILEEIDQADDNNWSEREKYWIDKYRSKGILNLREGGKHNYINRKKEGITRSSFFHQKKIIQLTKDNVFVKEWESLKEAAIFYGVVHSAIGNVLSKRATLSCGYHWVFKEEYSSDYKFQVPEPEYGEAQKLPVIVTNITTDKVMYFDSIKGCAEYFSVSEDSVSQYLRGIFKAKKSKFNKILNEYSFKRLPSQGGTSRTEVVAR